MLQPPRTHATLDHDVPVGQADRSIPRAHAL